MSEKVRNGRQVMAGLLLAGVLLAAFVAACDTKSPVGPGAVTPASTTTSTVGAAPPAVGTLTAAFTVSPTVATIGQQVTVNASASAAAPGRSIAEYDWNFGNGTTRTGVNTSSNYAAAGAFPIVLTITDDAGQKATATQTVTVVQPGPTTTTAPPSNAVVHYVGTPPTPNIPADLTLLFQLISSVSSFLSRMSIIRPMADSTYAVSGSWLSNDKSLSGGIKGQFVGTLAPAVNGQFTGTLTAQTPGCTGERAFTGTLGQALSLSAGNILADCPTSPWAGYTSIGGSQSSAPPPTSTSTAPSSSTTSTSTTTSSTSSSTTSIPVLSDLAPTDPEDVSFCRPDPKRADYLLVQVTNLGGGAAGPFEVQMAFGEGGGLKAVGRSVGVAAKSPVDVSVGPADTRCFTSFGCSFSILVDSTFAVPEGDEFNNTADGFCGGDVSARGRRR